MNDQRIYDVFNSATTLFIRNGYGQTQISDIAKSASISTGAVYTLFQSKKAIFQFVLRGVFEEGYLQSEITLPIREMDTEELSHFVEKSVEMTNDRLWAAAECGSFQEALSTMFDAILKYGAGFLIFERNTVSWPELSGIYYKKRGEFIKRFERCVDACIEHGEVRQLENPSQHARLMIETFSFWAMHRKYDHIDIQMNDNDAKKLVIDALAHAYCIEK